MSEAVSETELKKTLSDLIDASLAIDVPLSTDARLLAMWIPSPLGPLLTLADSQGIHLLSFYDGQGLFREVKRLRSKFGAIAYGQNVPLLQAAQELEAYFAGTLREFTLKVSHQGTVFQNRAWDALRAIPFGQTRSYAQQATALQQPKATRAVGAANGANPVAIIVPCHRVIGADGKLTGFGGKLWRKKWLLDHEKQIVAPDLFSFNRTH